jgi:hypothetical protein
MAQLVANCPRCSAQHVTFDVFSSFPFEERYRWQTCWEAFARCRACGRSTIFVVVQKDTESKDELQKCQLNIEAIDDVVNRIVRVERFVNISDLDAPSPPEHVPAPLAAVFSEGARCVAIGCYNAAGAMFRLCVDLATKSMLPEGPTAGLKRRTRRELAARLEWLFTTGRLPAGLQELSSCIREDGNDGAHDGTLQKADAEDLKDFAFALLERLYTEPERLRLAKERREQRRTPKG